MTITVEKQGPVAIVTLNRPETKNAITQEMRGQLYGAFEDIAMDHDVRAVPIHVASIAIEVEDCDGVEVR